MTIAAEAPSGAALRRAERANAEAGHENLGFLSTTHGFLPREPPRLSLPDTHRAWDETAARLPELWRAVAVRDALTRLPVLDVDGLEDADLWRASCLISIFAHAFVRNEAVDTPPLPESIHRPWEALTARMGRPKPFLSYNDLIVYNWRLLDEDAPDPMRVENLDLLVPTVGNQSERVFYLTQVEIAAQCAALVHAAVRAQTAVLRDDPAALTDELLLVYDRLRHVTEVSLQKIDQNPRSPTYVDPVVWATTVAPFAVPIDHDVAGPSGTAAPIFHLLDGLFGRRSFATVLGHESLKLRGWFPPHHREFLEAVAEVSVPQYVRDRGDRSLNGLFRAALDAYAGPRGYLGAHRLKVYGYLELAFKVGRAVTIGGFAGAFRDQTWKQIDGELEGSRLERYEDAPHAVRHAVVQRRARVGSAVHRVVLDVGGVGVPYRPGDHCHVLPENAPALVDRTLAALRARGRERVPLTREWQDALRRHPEYEADPPAELAVRDFLRRAKLRPVLRPVAKALIAVTASEGLDAILEARTEDQRELWDVLELLAEEGYDPRRLWRSELWQDEAIARIVPSETVRTYSVASALDGRVARTLDLTVGRLRYVDPGGVTRRGTASTYLTELADDGSVALDVTRPTRFRLPEDPALPIVMFAGGSGIAPFRGFLEARVTSGAPGENWLFFGTRTRNELYYRDELEALVAAGRLELRCAFSRDEDERSRAHVPDVMERDDNARELWRLLEEGAHVYVCGRAAFAHAVTESLVQIAARFSQDDPREVVRRLVADRRYMQDVFTTFAPRTAPGIAGDGVYDTSEVVLHNDAERGYWLVIDGNVYDVTEFMHLHYGGPTPLAQNVGLDASREFRAVLHHENSEVEAMLPTYKIGSIRRLDFGSRWGIALVPGEGISYVRLRDLFRAWARYLYLVVEMENALRNDFRFLREALTDGEDAGEMTPLKVQFAANTHLRFLEAYLEGSVGEDLHRLHALTVGLCAPHEPAGRVRAAAAHALASPDAAEVRRRSELARTLYRDLRGGDAEAWERARRFSALVEEHDQRYLADLKRLVREGVRVFEELEGATLDKGGDRLVAVLDGIARLLEAYCARFVAATGQISTV